MGCPAAVDWIKGFEPGIEVTTNPFIGFNASGQPTYGDPYSYIGDEDKHRLLTLKQKVAEFSASGKVIDGWAGEIHAAFGASWREEGIDQKVRAPGGNEAADPTYYPVWCPDSVVATNLKCIEQVAEGIRPAGNIGVRGVPGNPYQNLVEIQFSNVPFVTGKFTVKELFAETIVPLLKDLPVLRDLTFQGAVRWADYAGSGSIWSYKGGLDANLTDEVRVRGTYSHDTRAANIAERFDRTGGFTAPITDRVSPLPTGWTNPTAVTTVNGGNPDVEPEEADTVTAGLVYRPQWLPGFDVSVDWLRVSLKGAIEQLLAQRVIDLCYQEGDTEQCGRISRDPTSNIILFVPQTYFNLSKSYHESVDLEMGYSHAVTIFGGGERIGARLFASYLIENSTTNAQGVKTDATGNLALQNFQKKANLTLSYTNGPFSFDMTGRWNGGGKLGTLGSLFNVDRVLNTGEVVKIWDVADNTVGSSVFWDARVGYEIPVGDGKLEMFANVINAFDRDPPNVLAENIATQTLGTGGVYDVLGRRYVMGFNLKF